MNKRQKEVLQHSLLSEGRALQDLKSTYAQALEDISEKVSALMSRMDADTPTVIYQVKWQRALAKQVSGALDALNSRQYETISDYLTECYETGFIGAMYDLQGQGIPLVMPIDQQAMTEAVVTDSKISEGLYTRLGKDVAQLKRRIASEVSRGIATSSSFAQIAAHLEAVASIGYGRAARIARTDGGRIQCAAQLDACTAAKAAGADVVKQWDSTLDSKTRPDHAAADGQVRELDADFLVGGEHMPAPLTGGSARNVCNCRCAMLQRARWALDDNELTALQERAAFFGLDKTADFEDYKSKFLSAIRQI